MATKFPMGWCVRLPFVYLRFWRDGTRRIGVVLDASEGRKDW